MNQSRGRHRSRNRKSSAKNGVKSNVKNPVKASPKESPKQAEASPKKSPKESPKQAEASPNAKNTSPRVKSHLLPYSMPHAQYTLDGKYSAEEPEFWKPIFRKNEMTEIKENLQIMMKTDCSIIPKTKNEWYNGWSVCQINQSLIPTYFIPMKGTPYLPPSGGLFGMDQIEFSNFNVILCSALIVFGLINHRMKQQPYRFLLKGGKAIQLVLAKTPNPPIYESEDIDILVCPTGKKEYQREEIKNLSAHLASLLAWFIEIPDIQCRVSILPPEKSKGNPDIYKLAYPFRAAHALKAFSDIDFKEIPEDMKVYYSKCIQYSEPIDHEYLDYDVTFTCPNITSMLNEKIFYYTKFLILSYLEEREGYTLDQCILFMDKFKRAILALNLGLQTDLHPKLQMPALRQLEIDYLLSRLVPMDMQINPTLFASIRKKEYIVGINGHERLPADYIQRTKDHLIKGVLSKLYA